MVNHQTTMSDDAEPKTSEFGWVFWVLLAVIVVPVAVLMLPNFIKPRATASKGVCIMNLKWIDGAVMQWALENKKAATDTYSLSDTTLLAYFKDSVLPVCPAGGRYLPGDSISGKPRCTIRGPGHSL